MSSPDEPIAQKHLRPWSISKGQIAQSCAFRFHAQYVHRLPKAKTDRSEGMIGAAAHLFIELYLGGTPLKEAYQRAATSQPLTHEEILEVRTFKDACIRFEKRIGEWREKMGVGDDEFFIEKEAAFTIYKQECGYWDKDAFFRGKWDIGALVHRGDKKYVIIIDHKTGNPPKPDDDNPLSKYEDQLRSYVASAYVLYPDIAGAQTAVHWMREDDPRHSITWGPMISSKKIEDKIMPWFWDYFDAARDNVQTETPSPNKGWYCGFCDYKYRCPLFK